MGNIIPYLGRAHQTFNTMEELERATYGGVSLRMLQKTDSPITTGDTAIWNKIYGKKAWVQVNQESNAFKILKKAPLKQTGVRVLTTRARSTANGVAEGATISDSVESAYNSYNLTVKQQIDVFEVSQLAYQLAQTNEDMLDAWESEREQFGILHAEMINVALLTDVDTLASNNFESIDRIVSSYAEVTNCGITAGDSDIYAIDRDAATGWSDANVDHNSNTNRSLNLSIPNGLMRDIWVDGGTPKVFLTGYDTYLAWSELLQSQQMFFGERKAKATYNGVTSAGEGEEGGFLVSTYNGVPIIQSKNVVDDSLSRIYCLDTDYLTFRVLQPTKFYASGIDISGTDPWAVNKLTNKGMYETIGEIECVQFARQSKARDLQT